MTVKIAFLFDLDGVLIDSEREYSKIWEKIESFHPTGHENFSLKIKGMTLDKILNDYFPMPDVREHVTELLYRLEKEMVYGYCPGALRFIEECVRRDIPRAVVTSSNEYKMNHLFYDIPDFMEKFPLIIDSSFVTRSKPDPEGYLLGAQKLGVNICNCAVFEDSVQGVMAGKAAGAYVVGITGTKPVEELRPYCDIIIDSLSEINMDNLIETLAKR